MPAVRRVSIEQMELMLQWMQNYPEQARSASFTTSHSKKMLNDLWEELASHLNAVGNGTTKTAKEWRVYWSDQKNKVRRKMAHGRSKSAPDLDYILSPIEKEVYSYAGAINDTDKKVENDVNIAPTEETPTTAPRVHSSMYVVSPASPSSPSDLYAEDVEVLSVEDVEPQSPAMSVAVKVEEEEDSRESILNEQVIVLEDQPAARPSVPSQNLPRIPRSPRIPQVQQSDRDLAFRRERLEAEERWRREALEREERWRREALEREERWRREALTTEERWRREQMAILGRIATALENLCNQN